MTRRKMLGAGTLVAAFALGLLASAAEFEPPDSVVNPQSQDIEIADPVWSGSNQDINYVIDHGDGSRPEVHVVTDNPLDDLRPRVAVAPDGDAWIAWWRDDTVDKVLVRKHNFVADTWDAERVISVDVESSRNPIVVNDSTHTWVAYEFGNEGATHIGVAIVIDEPDPIGIRDDLGTTDYTGPVDVTIYSDQNQLWVTWVDSDTEVGWAEYDYESAAWGLPAYESYAADSVDDARDRIRNSVLGN